MEEDVVNEKERREKRIREEQRHESRAPARTPTSAYSKPY
jgi:hypothetical protein